MELEPTLAEALREIVNQAIDNGQLDASGYRVYLSIDLLTQLGLVNEDAAEKLARIEARYRSLPHTG